MNWRKRSKLLLVFAISVFLFGCINCTEWTDSEKVRLPARKRPPKSELLTAKIQIEDYMRDAGRQTIMLDSTNKTVCLTYKASKCIILKEQTGIRELIIWTTYPDPLWPDRLPLDKRLTKKGAVLNVEIEINNIDIEQWPFKGENSICASYVWIIE